MNEMPLKKVVKNDQSGQAVVEYILLLAITVALILGLMNKFYKPYGDWMRDYMGVYLECLIDIGELPSLGFDGGSGECSARMKAGNNAAGIGGKTNPPGNYNSNANNNAGNRGKGGSGDDGNGGSSVAGSNRSSGQTRGFEVGKPSGADGPGSNSNGSGAMSEKLPESQYFKSRGKSFSMPAQNERTSSTGITGLIRLEQQKIQRREARAFSSVKSEEGGEEARKAKKLIIKKGERKIASDEATPSWSISDYLKYALIIVIIIAIVLFLAGQALQISKGMEK